MTNPGHSDLYVATYDEPSAALRDARLLEAVEEDEDLQVFGVVVMSRHDDGKVDVLVATEGAGEDVTDWCGGSSGIVVGLFAPELLLATPAGTAAGPALSSLIRAHEEGRFGFDLDEAFPPESAVVVLVVAPNQVHRVDGVLLHAGKVTTRRIEDEDFDLVRAALAAPDQSVET